MSTTSPAPGASRRPAVRLALALGLALALAACSGAAAPSAAQPSPSDPPVPTPPSVSSPGASAPPGLEPAGPSGDPGTGIGAPVDPTPVDPAAGQPKLVVAKPGQLNPHPVAPQTLQASLDGRHVLVKVSWYSGIEPCYVLDSVKVDRSGLTIAITVIEGTSDPNAICAEIAMLKATIVDLGDLDVGTWTITAPNSEAAPITVTIE